ncbi:MAG: mannitol dehydrogenase family protein [Tissierellia bacterium]|nr:mannitol dehydrogenase family protein [Tissierellia bacterium]
MDLEYFLNDRKSFEQKGLKMPDYDIYKMRKDTKENPQWIHFGAGNLFRGYIASLADDLLNKKEINTGIIAASCHHSNNFKSVFKDNDNLTIKAILNEDGHIDYRLIASVADNVNVENAYNFNRLKEIFKKESLKFVTFTITEKGYEVFDSQGSVKKKIIDQIEKEFPQDTMLSIASLLYERYKLDLNISVISFDNFSHNGIKLKKSIKEMAKLLVDKKGYDKEFLDYLDDGEKITFPNTTIDKITPEASMDIKKDLIKKEIIVDNKNEDKNKQIFVNTEKKEYLVIEDNFTNGKIPLDKVGVFFVDKSTVDKFEKMKVCTCLNPIHTALAIFGKLLDKDSISECMEDYDLNKLTKKLGFNEGMKTVSDPEIVDPKEFLKEVLEKRLPNPFIPDTPSRIATDTSQKLKIRFGETIKSYIEDEKLDLNELEIIPLVIAGWLRYLMGVDDFGMKMEISSDPLLEEIKDKLEKVKFKGDFNEHDIKNVLKMKNIFGLDLTEHEDFCKKIIDEFRFMNEKEENVRKLLKEKVEDE